MTQHSMRVDGHPRLPRITVVTPVVGDDNHLEATVRSVVYQDYANLEYVVIEDGTSQQRCIMLQKYADRLSRQLCAPGTELCAALNMAFANTTGEIMGWLEPGEMLHLNGLQVVGSVFASLPQVDWITGRPFIFSPSGLPTGIKHLERWSRIRFLAGLNKYIHRDTTFWRRSLWDRVGGALSTAYGLAGEFDMFVRFFRHAPVYSVEALIAGYRTHPGYYRPDGTHNVYNNTCDQIADKELATVRGAYAAKALRRTTRLIRRIPRVRLWWYRYVLPCGYRCPGPDWRPRIIADGDTWRFES